jgi:hypothetical protein
MCFEELSVAEGKAASVKKIAPIHALLRSKRQRGVVRIRSSASAAALISPQAFLRRVNEQGRRLTTHQHRSICT